VPTDSALNYMLAFADLVAMTGWRGVSLRVRPSRCVGLSFDGEVDDVADAVEGVVFVVAAAWGESASVGVAADAGCADVEAEGFE